MTFRSSGNLAATYGVALSMTMTVTTILFAVVARNRWHWPLVAGRGRWRRPFLIVDLAFVGANLLKVPHGGWFPLVVAVWSTS